MSTDITKVEDHPSSERTFIVFIGRVKLEFDSNPVTAAQILTGGGAVPPEDFTLEALRGERGETVASYAAGEPVDLTLQHHKHFRANPNGGGRA